jgi:hypothetical protein
MIENGKYVKILLSAYPGLISSLALLFLLACLFKARIPLYGINGDAVIFVYSF